MSCRRPLYSCLSLDDTPLPPNRTKQQLTEVAFTYWRRGFWDDSHWDCRLTQQKTHCVKSCQAGILITQRCYSVAARGAYGREHSRSPSFHPISWMSTSTPCLVLARNALALQQTLFFTALMSSLRRNSHGRLKCGKAFFSRVPKENILTTGCLQFLWNSACLHLTVQLLWTLYISYELLCIIEKNFFWKIKPQT